MHSIFKEFQNEAEQLLGELAKEAKKYYFNNNPKYFMWLQKAYLLKKAKPDIPDIEISAQTFDLKKNETPTKKHCLKD